MARPLSTLTAALNAAPKIAAFQDKAKKLTDALHVAAADGLTLDEVTQIVLDATADLVEHAVDLPVAGDEKKSQVTDVLISGLATLLPAIPLPPYLLIFRPLINRAALAIARRLLSGAIEAAYRKLKPQLAA